MERMTIDQLRKGRRRGRKGGKQRGVKWLNQSIANDISSIVCCCSWIEREKEERKKKRMKNERRKFPEEPSHTHRRTYIGRHWRTRGIARIADCSSIWLSIEKAENQSESNKRRVTRGRLLLLLLLFFIRCGSPNRQSRGFGSEEEQREKKYEEEVALKISVDGDDEEEEQGEEESETYKSLFPRQWAPFTFEIFHPFISGREMEENDLSFVLVLFWPSEKYLLVFFPLLLLSFSRRSFIALSLSPSSSDCLARQLVLIFARRNSHEQISLPVSNTYPPIDAKESQEKSMPWHNNRATFQRSISHTIHCSDFSLVERDFSSAKKRKDNVKSIFICPSLLSLSRSLLFSAVFFVRHSARRGCWCASTDARLVFLLDSDLSRLRSVVSFVAGIDSIEQLPINFQLDRRGEKV